MYFDMDAFEYRYIAADNVDYETAAAMDSTGVLGDFDKENVDISFLGNKYYIIRDSEFDYGNIYEYVDGVASLVKKDGHVFGLKCIDHCTLEMQTGPYWLNYNESYPVRYYKVNKDVEETYSYEKGVYVEVAMCDWFLEPSVYEDNGSVVSPAIRKEELLGYSMPETLTNNIYIDRGYSTVLDKHLRMVEISSLEALEKYGNGSFNIINLEEETI